jgi:hypothetical protein
MNEPLTAINLTVGNNLCAAEKTLICGKAVPLAANQKETALSGKSRIHHTVVIGLKAVHFREGVFFRSL